MVTYMSGPLIRSQSLFISIRRSRLPIHPKNAAMIVRIRGYHEFQMKSGTNKIGIPRHRHTPALMISKVYNCMQGNRVFALNNLKRSREEDHT